MILSLAGFGLYQAGQAGVGLDVFLRQPALAAAAIGVMANGDYEFVSLDKYRGTLTLRQADNGQTWTLPPEQVLRGDVMESGRTIGTLLGRSSAASGMPAWIPPYPGSRSRGVVHQDAPGIRKGVASFEASAAARRVADYYDQALRKRGIEVTSLSETPAIALSGKSDDGSRELEVVVTSLGMKSGIRITFAERD